jgi:hypothetical protein
MRESIAGMIKWPRSTRTQATIAFVVALLSAGYVFLQFAGDSFNRFYFPPHKAYPFPFPTARAYQTAMWRDCGLTFLAVFAILYVVQRRFFATRHT